MSNLSSKGLYGTLPKALTERELITRARFEDPEIQAQRRALTQAKSVSELGAIHGLSDFPLPKNIERLLAGPGAGMTEAEKAKKAAAAAAKA